MNFEFSWSTCTKFDANLDIAERNACYSREEENKQQKENIPLLNAR